MSRASNTTPSYPSDRGGILPLVLVVTVVLGAVVIAIASYTATVLRYGQVSESRAGRISAAQGAMDDTIERLSLRSSLCTTVSGSAGATFVFPEPLNGSNVEMQCAVTAGSAPPVDGFAIVVTGEGAPNDGSPILEFRNGGTPEIKGPVFVSNLSRIDFKKDTIIEEGELWYPDVPCAESVPGDPSLQYRRAVPQPIVPKLVFSPTTRGINCVNQQWQQLFGTGPVVPDLTALPTNPTYTTSGGCRVFIPGRYTALPLLTGNNTGNYFMSGNYVFDNIGLVQLSNTKVTMGHTTRAGYPAIENDSCDSFRTTSDPDSGGATLYTRGNTSIEARNQGGFELSGRLQGNAIVGLQVLDSSLAYGTGLLRADPGGGKELSIQGLLWAPYSSITFETIPAKTAAVLRGGAIVASFRGEVSNAASGFVIEVATSPSRAELVIDAIATDSRGSNTVRVVADYRPSTGEIAVKSRRVLP